MPHLAEGYVGVHDEVVLCGWRELVCCGIRLWIEGSAAPDVITEIVFPAHLQKCIFNIDHILLLQEHDCLMLNACEVSLPARSYSVLSS